FKVKNITEQHFLNGTIYSKPLSEYPFQINAQFKGDKRFYQKLDGRVFFSAPTVNLEQLKLPHNIMPFSLSNLNLQGNASIKTWMFFKNNSLQKNTGFIYFDRLSLGKQSVFNAVHLSYL